MGNSHSPCSSRRFIPAVCKRTSKRFSSTRRSRIKTQTRAIPGLPSRSAASCSAVQHGFRILSVSAFPDASNLPPRVCRSPPRQTRRSSQSSRTVSVRQRHERDVCRRLVANSPLLAEEQDGHGFRILSGVLLRTFVIQTSDPQCAVRSTRMMPDSPSIGSSALPTREHRHGSEPDQRIAWPGVEEVTSRSPGWIGPPSLVTLTGTMPVRARSVFSHIPIPSARTTPGCVDTVSYTHLRAHET